MGLRHRTAVSILRQQRRNAESQAQTPQGKVGLRATRRIFFSQIDPAGSQRNHSFTPPLNRQDQEDSLRLIHRLRQALHPLPADQLQASKEYESLQDELLRLSQHIAQQKSRTPTDVWDDTSIPYAYPAAQGPDDLPYRTIKIVADDSGNRSIERLDAPPSDLSSYRHLSLVAPEASPAPEAQDLLINAEVQLGDATANLTQQSLDNRGPRSAQVSIRPEVALSLLDT